MDQDFKIEFYLNQFRYRKNRELDKTCMGIFKVIIYRFPKNRMIFIYVKYKLILSKLCLWINKQTAL